MFSVFVSVIFILCIQNHQALQNEYCGVVETSKNASHLVYKNDIINDTFTGLIKVFHFENIIRMKWKPHDYLTASMSISNDMLALNIYTSNKFYLYDQLEEKNRINLLITFFCKDNERKSLKFVQQIRDTNNNEPFFSKPEYTFELPMPWPKLMDITLVQDIVVTDYDFTNKYILFEVLPNDYFTIDLKYKQGRNYTATIKLKQDLYDDLPERQFYIYATDQKDDFGVQHTTRAKIIIDPVREENMREFNYDNNLSYTELATFLNETENMIAGATLPTVFNILFLSIPVVLLTASGI